MTAVVPLMRCNDTSGSYVEQMARSLVPLALPDLGLLDSLFLAACRHLASNYQQGPQYVQYTRLALQYKLLCIHSVIEAIPGKAQTSDVTILGAMMLAYDEVLKSPSLRAAFIIV